MNEEEIKKIQQRMEAMDRPVAPVEPEQDDDGGKNAYEAAVERFNKIKEDEHVQQSDI